jgi:predicted RNA binding protein YcfA (HicA-like mRNA interferase family)
MSKLPVISGKELVKALKKAGFVEVRQRGSHVSLQKMTAEKTFKTVVPLHRELAKGTVLDILHQTGLKKDPPGNPIVSLQIQRGFNRFFGLIVSRWRIPVKRRMPQLRRELSEHYNCPATYRSSRRRY